MIDCAVLAFLGTFVALRLPEGPFPYTAGLVLDMLLFLLAFATMRLMVRQELYDIFKRPLPLKRRLWILACLAFLVSTWVAVLESPRPIVLPSGSYARSVLKNVGTALEMYSADHGGAYPARLEELKPRYLKQFPGPCTTLSEKEIKFYEKDYGPYLGYTYAVDGEARTYTVTCRGNRIDPSGLMYTSTEGLVEQSY